MKSPPINYLQSRVAGLTAAPKTNLAQLLVGFSGGLDSTVLLHMATMLAQSPQPCAIVRAIYVDHGLQCESVNWATHCRTVCDALGVAFDVISVNVERQAQGGPEDAARQARYTAFAKVLKPDEYLLTAHHADDQAETVLLQLLRGAGVAGLAAMPELKPFAAGHQWRPLLALSRAQLHGYAQHQQLRWIEDPSNTDTSLDRNFLRNDIMPLLACRWPAVSRVLGRSAKHCAEAAQQQLLLARMDCPVIDLPAPLSCAAVRELPQPRRLNVLRQWIALAGYRPPSVSQIENMDRSMVLAEHDSQALVRWGGAAVRHYAGQLYLGSEASMAEAEPFDLHWADTKQPLYIPQLNQSLSPHTIPSTYAGGMLRVHSRRGGEKFLLEGRRHRISLKNWLQQQRVAPWLRSRVVLFYEYDRLLGVYGPVSVNRDN